MRLHQLAMMAVLTAALGSGCDSPREVRDTGRANANGCNHCHGYPPPPVLNPESNHPMGVTASSCFLCHSTTVLDEDGYTLVAGGTHRNSTVEVDPGWQTPPCGACHDDPPDTGRHLFHWNRMVRAGGETCSTCHRGFDVGDGTPGTRMVEAAVHMNGQPDVILSDELTIPTANAPDGEWSLESCMACHDALGVGGSD